MKGLTPLVAALVTAAGFVATPAVAQMTGVPTPGYITAPGAPSQTMPQALREIGFDQNLDQKLPLDARFVDDEGKPVTLGSYYGHKPVLLAFVYYTCPMLCTQVLNAMTASISMLSLDAGKDFELVLVSIDPRETAAQAAAKKAEYLHRYKRTGADAGWHFLTGTEPEIKRAAVAAGFRYAWDEQTQQYAHPTGIIVTTPDGRLARYLFGIEYGPRDLKLALVEASDGKIGTFADQLLLYCFHYDPMTGRYGVYIIRTLRVAGVVTVLSIGMFILVMVRRERSQQSSAH
ncbi:MAG: SCO family protein [Vicinamibacterales bacterium]